MKKSIICSLVVLFLIVIPAIGGCESSKENEKILINAELIEVKQLDSSGLQKSAVLANPTVVVLNNSEGTIKMVDKLSSEIVLQHGKHIQEVGVSIYVAPKIVENEEIAIKVNADISKIKSYTANGEPVIELIEPKAELVCKSGETAFLGSSPINESNSIFLIKITPTILKE